MNNFDKLAALLADGMWHSERSLYNNLGFPEWFHTTVGGMVRQGLIQERFDPWGGVFYRMNP